MRSMKFLALAAALSLGACSDNNAKIDGPVVKKDTTATPGSDAVFPATSLLQTVVNKYQLPQSGTDYPFDFGSGPKNKLGTLVQVLNGAGFNLQNNLDETVQGGAFLLLLELFGKSLADDANTGVEANLGTGKGGAITDAGAPAPNFTGTGEFTIKTGTTTLKLAGKITGGKLTAAGDLLITIPAGDDASKYPLVTIKKGRLEAIVADSATSAMTSGKINGLLPWTDVTTKIIPAMQVSVDKAYKDPNTAAATKTLMKTLFDVNGDGTITVDEITNSAALKLVLSPDVDGGSGTLDSMSVGMGFTAVKAKIVK